MAKYTSDRFKASGVKAVDASISFHHEEHFKLDVNFSLLRDDGQSAARINWKGPWNDEVAAALTTLQIALEDYALGEFFSSQYVPKPEVGVPDAEPESPEDPSEDEQF